MRGKRLKTSDIGIMRIDITASCRSRVLRSRSARPAPSAGQRCVERLAVLGQHGLRDDQLAHQVDELIHLLDRHAQREVQPWRRPSAGACAGGSLPGAGAADAAGAAGPCRSTRRQRPARRALRRRIRSRCRPVQVLLHGRRAGRARRESRSPGRAAAACTCSRATWKVNRSSRSSSLLPVSDLEAAHAVGVTGRRPAARWCPGR
jgi:hypothetical protein